MASSSNPKSSAPSASSPSAQPAAVTGVQLMRGIGARPARGFWAEAWSQVVKKPTAVAAMAWLAVVAFFAFFAPVLASGHPLWMSWTDAAGVRQSGSPLWQNLRALDLILLALALAGTPYILRGERGRRMSRVWTVIGAGVVAIAILAIASFVQGRLEAAATEAARAAIRSASTEPFVQPLVRRPSGGYIIAGAIAAVVTIVFSLLPVGRPAVRVPAVVLASLLATAALGARWTPPLERFDYTQREAAGAITATYTVVPWSPAQRYSELQRKPPLTVFGKATGLKPETAPYGRVFLMGTDAFGSDVLSQVLHACRLSISIGVVSTCIALLIGVTMGAMMGYFGGWVDLLLYRVVEIFMAVPVLFLLIVAVAVLPDEFKTTYVIMGIIGCFTWTGMARFTRAEFLKLRHQDFVQAAQATGVPLRSVLFKHMLPNGVAPVLVDTSFAVAAAISIEAVLSFLGLGPVDSPSWGKLLSSAISQEGEFKPWLAIYPGAAIFLTVLSYNLIGEALRDAIDPKLKKARV